jgi:hypothetical protein
MKRITGYAGHFIWLATAAVLAAIATSTAWAQLETASSLPDTTHVRRDPVTLATREYRDGGVARTIVEGSFVTFPYGHSQPTLTCTVLRACVIQLQPGEVVLSKITGDTERWEIAPAPSGADGQTALVVVKPRDCEITTNLLLATDRRLYDLTLDSPPCKSRSTNPQGPYVRHVRFYYPDAMVDEWLRPAPLRVAAGRPRRYSTMARGCTSSCPRPPGMPRRPRSSYWRRTAARPSSTTRLWAAIPM